MIKPTTIQAEATLNDAIRIIGQERVDTIFVVGRDNHLLGFLDIEDINQGTRGHKSLRKAIQQHIYTAQIDSELQNPIRMILKRSVRNVPVVDDQQRLVGLITCTNVVDIVYDTIWGDSGDTV